MERTGIAVEARTETGKGIARRLRRAGKVPAVIYGAGVDQPRSVAVVARDIVAILNRPDSMNRPIDLVAGEERTPVVIKDYQVHPISRAVLHLDFLALKDDVETEVEVPIQTTGRSLGEELGARLFIVRREIKVRCLPGKIPGSLVADISEMDIGDVLYVDELDYPEGVQPIYKARYPVIVIQKAKAIEEDVVDEEAEEGLEEGEGAEGDEEEKKEGAEEAPEKKQ